MNDEELDGVVPSSNLGDIGERREQSTAKEPGPGSGRRPIDEGEKRASLGALDRAHELQVGLRRFVENQPFAGE